MKQEIRFCISPGGVHIAYATSGSGPPLVKVANWLSHLEFDWQSPVWRHWLTALSRDHLLVRYDGRGCGLSDRDVESVSLGAFVEDLETVVDTTGVHQFPLLGISAGGAVAIAYSVRHPDKVSHLILCGAFGSRTAGEYATEERERAKAILRLMRVGWGQNNPAFRQFFTSLFIPEGTPEQMAWFNDLQRASTSPAMAETLQRAFYNVSVREWVSKVSVPTLVLHARDDAVVPFADGRRLAALIPGARFVPLESKNHVLLEDEPAWTRFLAEVRSFIGSGAASPEQRASLNAFPELTPRQQEILELVAQGRNNTEIAERLVISPKTVRNYVSRIYDKLEVKSRAQAIVLAREAGVGRQEK